MKINAYQCPKCLAAVYSRTRHDYRWCPCHTIAVDGGLDYTRVVYSDCIPEHYQLDLDVTAAQLHEDWSRRTDKYGIVTAFSDTKGKKHV